MTRERLFVYGSLQPGGPNEHLLSAIDGKWEPASVLGNLVHRGWGADIGYPGLVLNDAGTKIDGWAFCSPDLNKIWDQLDEFEGIEYERRSTSIALGNGTQADAFVYVLRSETTVESAPINFEKKF